jgi:predicted nuclease of predicted toxin-antitoxin system
VKFLVDASAGRKIADWLCDAGYDVVFTPDLGPDPGDAALMQLAVDESRVVVTVDRNFGRAVHTAGAETTGMIVLPGLRHAVRLTMLKQAVTGHRADLLAGRWVVASPGNIRVHSPPRKG